MAKKKYTKQATTYPLEYRETPEFYAGAMLHMALEAARKIEGDVQLSGLVEQLSSLPGWKENPEQWRRGLNDLFNPFPARESLTEEENEQQENSSRWMLSRAGDAAYLTVFAGNGETRHRNLTFVGLYAGMLWHRALGGNSAAIQAAINSEVSMRARKAARASHKDNYADKSEVFLWLDSNRSEYPSLEACADAMVNANLVSAARKTIRNWCTKWNKEQRVKP